LLGALVSLWRSPLSSALIFKTCIGVVGFGLVACSAPGGDSASTAPLGVGNGTVGTGTGNGTSDGSTVNGGGIDLSGTPAGPCANVLANTLPVTYRDFNESHPDFEMPFLGDVVRRTLLQPAIGTDRKPVFRENVGCPADTLDAIKCANWMINPPVPVIQAASSFDQWYRTVSGVNLEMPGVIELTEQMPGSGMFVFDSTQFFPLGPDVGFGITPPGNFLGKNFLFTTEIHVIFTYSAGQIFTFRGDDDLWVFVNDQIAMDLGSLHLPAQASIDFDAQATRLGITPGNTYAMDIFHAERHTSGSNFRFETNIQCFVPVDLR
jgi:fibro-slime domain-containing protein